MHNKSTLNLHKSLKMYTKQFEIRWSDVDANRHLRNSAYIDYMSHTRMSFMLERGMDQRHLAEYNLGHFMSICIISVSFFPGSPLRFHCS